LRSRAIACALLGLLFAAAPAAGEVYLSQREALAIAFPGADRIERKSVVLGDAQAATVERLSGAKLESRIVTLHEGFRGEERLGYAVIDVHTVRTLPEAFMVVLSPEGRVAGLRILAFYEPSEYKPSDRFLAQFDARTLGPELRLGGAIHGIAGSSLSSRAVTMGVRRSLALYEVLVRGGDGAVALCAAGAASGR
jgi:Na+-translocating ferredoxin:NAD+ oxidoreductase subunit G